MQSDVFVSGLLQNGDNSRGVGGRHQFNSAVGASGVLAPSRHVAKLTVRAGTEPGVPDGPIIRPFARWLELLFGNDDAKTEKIQNPQAATVIKQIS
jgi:hypothetical protein